MLRRARHEAAPSKDEAIERPNGIALRRGRRLYRRNKGDHALALAGVVLCAFFLALAIVVNIHPGLALRLLGLGYPISIYLAIILCLVAAILALLPAVRLR